MKWIELKRIIKYFYLLIIIIFLLLFKFISLSKIITFYFLYCIYFYLSTKSSLYYQKTDFNNTLLSHCPSIKEPNFKQYFLLPFTIFQFIILKYTVPKLSKKLFFKEEKINPEGTSIIWANYETQNLKDNHNLPILLVLPGITGKITDPYLRNLVINGLNYGYDVVIYQMRTLSHEMRMPKNQEFVDFCEDLENSILKIKEHNPNNKIYCISGSYGANLLVTYLGTRNLKTNFFEGGVALSNPFDFYLSQRMGNDSIYETFILKCEKRNYIAGAEFINKEKKENYFNINTLKTSLTIKQFDKEFFGKILGYNTADDYYHGISSYNFVKFVNKPLLLINSKDDPVASFNGVPFDNIIDNKNIIFIATDKGGHMCYVENKNGNIINFKPNQWSFKPIFEFINYLKSLSYKK